MIGSRVKPSLHHHLQSSSSIAAMEETTLESRGGNGQPLVGFRRTPLTNIRTEYMSLKKSKKPLPPWKGPHGERYNLEGYTELSKALLNKSNNASTTCSTLEICPPRRTMSECMLASYAIDELKCNSSQSLPNATSCPGAPADTSCQCPNNMLNTNDDTSVIGEIYYYKVSDDDLQDNLEASEATYYYALQKGGDVVVTTM